VEGTRNLCQAAADAGIEHLFFLSHLGADRSSAYPVLRAKADAEESIKASGVPYTILRTGPAFGIEDHLTVPLAMLLAVSPLVFLMPGDGATLLQPIWVEDLATCITWGLDDPSMRSKTFEIGGPEFVTYRQLVERVGRFAGYVRFLVPTRQPYLRAAGRIMERFLPFPPLTTFNLDYLAANRTASLDSLPSIFGLKPSTLEDKLDYLRGANWGWELAARQLRREYRGRR
jgi:NADH dehydrogenase